MTNPKLDLIVSRYCFHESYTRGKMDVVYKSGTQALLASFHTVEKPWRQNLPNVSCIPNGVYEAERSFFNRGGYKAVEILGVPDRTDILIHVANRAEDVSGCIGIGMEDALDRVGHSRAAVSSLEDLVWKQWPTADLRVLVMTDERVLR